MKITLILMAKTSSSYLREGIAEYSKRLQHYCDFNIIELPSIKNTQNWPMEKLKEKEEALYVKELKGDEYLVLLDDKGRTYDSMEFSNWIERLQSISTKHLVFIVGGAYGFSEGMYKLSKEKLSLSKMTFSHQLVRLIFLEQLYRGFTIIHNEPYHHS